MNIKIDYLSGNGSFDSEECIALLQEADIVVTNPPFSLFREYLVTLMKYNKKFLIIGNMNAITYKEIFPYIKNNEIWLGVSKRSLDFILPNGNITNVNSIWFTNLDHKKRHQEIDLYKHYNAEEYPKYDNYCAFNVNKVADIPMDEYIDIEIPDDEYHFWKKAYGDDVEIIERSDEDKNT